MLDVKYKVLSRPAEVWWAGFRSDTYRLQQEGWEIAADEDVQYGRIRLILRHRDMRLYAICNELSYEYQRMHNVEGGPPLVFRVQCAAPEINIRFIPSVGMMQWDQYRQIDAQPQVMQQEQIKSLDDFKIFATPLTRTEELIVEPETVAAMLEKIRQMQAPEQQRIRKDASRRSGADAQPRQTFHAQIISLADHRRAA